MKIKIEHIPNTLNYGSLMMAVNIISKLADIFNKQVSFYVDCKTEKDLERLKKETLYNDIYIYKTIDNNEKNKVLKLIKLKKTIKKESKMFDGLIVIGGDDISEYYGIKSLISKLIRIQLFAKSIPVYLVGQTIGPFNHIYTRLLAKKVLNKVNLYVRDRDCLEYLEKIGVKNIFDSRDLAFLDLPLQSDNKVINNILNKYDIKNKRYITIVPSGLTESYTKDRESYINGQVNIIKSLMKNEKLEIDVVILLSHVLSPEYVDDRNIIKEIMKRIGDEYKNKLIPVYDELLSSEARIILGNGLFSITGRMHAAVSTYQMGKPSLALSYSVKYKGVLGSGLGMNELIIEANNDEIWKGDKIVEQVNMKVNYIIENYDELINHIKVKLLEVKEMVNLQIEDIANKLKQY